jgi:hypothetical protein
MKVIGAISGHASLRELARYTDSAEQVMLAEQGIAAITRTSSGKLSAPDWQPSRKANKTEG